MGMQTGGPGRWGKFGHRPRAGFIVRVVFMSGLCTGWGMELDPLLLRRALVSVLGSPAISDKLGLSEALDVLDSAVRDPRVTADARLHHFLRNRSYQKALDWMGRADKA